MAEEIMLDIDLIQIDPEIQIREVHTTSILGLFNLFKEIYRVEGPKALPPVMVYHDCDGVYWLADGHYRVAAAREVFGIEGGREIAAKVQDGSKRDAIFWATSANGKHGQRLTHQEVRTAVWRLLEDPEWCRWSDRAIARHVGTSPTFVGKVRKLFEDEAAASVHRGQILPASRVVIRGHTKFPMRTNKIGRTRSVPKRMRLKTASITAVDDTAPGDEFAPTNSPGLNFLMLAWQQAKPEERRAFREWIHTQPDDDVYELVEISTPEIEQIRTGLERARETTGVSGSIRVTQLRLKAGNGSED